MLIGSQELGISAFMRRYGCGRRISNFKINRNGRRRINTSNAPLIRAALAYFRLRDVVRLDLVVLESSAGADGARDFEFPRRQHLERSGEAHDQVPGVRPGLVVGVPPEDPPQTFFEDRLREGITQDGDASCSINAAPHFMQADLIQRTSKTIDDVGIGGGPLC